MKKVLLVLGFLVFLSFTSTRPANAARFQAASRNMNWFKIAKNFYKGFKKGTDAYNEFQNLGIGQSGSKDPSLNPDVSVDGFYTTFYVGGVQKQEVDAWIDINSALTWIENYNYLVSSSNYLCCRIETSDDSFCDTYHPTNPTACYRYQGLYVPAADDFVFGDTIKFEQVDFMWFPIPSATNVNTQAATGVLSFSRDHSNLYSLVWHFHYPGFSYYFTYSGDSTITVGEQPNATYASNFQSIRLLQNLYNPGYEDLYYVPAPQISVGKRSLQINPATEFYYGVVIDTTVPCILLTVTVHDKVVTELQSQIGQPVTTDNGIPMCYNKKPHWPDITLSFPSGSGYAQMVLRKHNYVVYDSDSDLECAVIYISQYVSVIGTMAQLDRNMIFDVNGSRLYFDRYSKKLEIDNGSGVNVIQPTIAFIFMMFYAIFILLY